MITILIQKLLTDFQLMTSVFCCKLFQNMLHIDLTKAKVIMDDFMGRTMTNMQMGCYLISGYMPSCQNCVTDVYSSVHRMGCGWEA